MEFDEFRRALDEAGSRPEIDVAVALGRVGTRARRRRRRQRNLASAVVLVGAFAVIVVVLAVAGDGPTREPVGVTVSTNLTYGSLPSRSEAAIAYDRARGRVVLFGGFDGSRMFGDTWLWDGQGWIAAHTAVVPPARERAAMAYDPATKEIVLFGGIVERPNQSSLALNDTWTWDGTMWTRRHPLHEPPWSSGLAMSYDPRSHSVLLLTLPSSHPNLVLTPDSVNSRGTTPFGTWRWDGSDWHELPTPSAPLFATAAIAFHGHPRLAALPQGAGLLFYSWAVYTGSCPPPAQCGGGRDPNGTHNSQTWTWDGTRWTEQHPSRAPVAAQLVATPGTDAVPTVFMSDGATWRWTGSNWDETHTRGEGPAGEGFAVYDEADTDIVAYAGDVSTDGTIYDTWTWNGSWMRRTQPSKPATTTPSTTSRGQGEPAVWFISSHDDVTNASKSFTAFVTRLGCNGGVTGAVLQPTIDARDTRIVVTFTVKAAPPGAHTCQGNDRVPIVVDLGEAIGKRQLVDGACRSGQAAATTSFCVEGSVRWKP